MFALSCIVRALFLSFKCLLWLQLKTLETVGCGSVSIPAYPTCPPTFVIGALTSQTLSSPMSPLMCSRMRLNERESALSKTLLSLRRST